VCRQNICRLTVVVAQTSARSKWLRDMRPSMDVIVTVTHSLLTNRRLPRCSCRSRGDAYKNLSLLRERPGSMLSDFVLHLSDYDLSDYDGFI